MDYWTLTRLRVDQLDVGLLWQSAALGAKAHSPSVVAHFSLAAGQSLAAQWFAQWPFYRTALLLDLFRPLMR